MTTDRLVTRTKLSKGAVIKARKGAIAKGWLVDIGPRPSHSQIRVYRLSVPEQETPAPIEPRTRNARGQFLQQTGPWKEPVQGVDRSAAEPQVGKPRIRTGPQEEPVRVMDGNRSTASSETGPPRGPESLTEALTESLSFAADLNEQEKRENLNDEDGPQPDRFTARLMAEHNATVDEVATVLAAASRDGVRNLPAWAASTVGRDDFARRLTEIRAKPTRREQTVCGHSGSVDPDTGGCLLCSIRAKRTAPDSAGPPPPPTTADDAAARALLAELLARGRAARERQDRRKAAHRRPTRLAEVIDPKAWEQRESVLCREGHRGLPDTDDQQEAAGA